MASSWLGRLVALQRMRGQTVRRALRTEGYEDRFRVLRFLVIRLPIPESTKRKVLQWGVSHILDRKQRSVRASIESAQQVWDSRAQARLRQMLDGIGSLEFAAQSAPRVSIILVTRNKAHLTLYTLDSIREHCSVPFELILVDNGSTDQTSELLGRIAGAIVIRNATNLGFGPACMQAAEAATGEYLCFFNNDALLTSGAIENALQNFDSPNVGAVGGKILLSNGSLQEAGSIIWSDGSALGYGRGDEPEANQYNFRRPVDYCSGVFLLTPRHLFREMGGFSAEFAPAYYEDTDYCMTLWQRGMSVVYEPEAVIRHYESASSGGNDQAMAMMAAHQIKFERKWHDVLARHYAPAIANVCRARISVHSTGARIVYVDDRVPERALGAGFPRSNDIATTLARLGNHLTYSTSTFPVIDSNRAGLPEEVEIFDGCRFREKLVGEHFAAADIVWVSRPHNLKLLWNEHASILRDRKFKLVYDAEAIFSQRSDARESVLGSPEPRENELEPNGFEEEVALAKLADLVTVVCEADQKELEQAGVRQVRVVGHNVRAVPTSAPFEERDAFLFVGSIHGLDNPNADSLRYFCEWSWPAIREATRARLLVAGYGTELMREQIADPTVEFLGKQEDLSSLYNRARVFIVPTRYAAGQPFKAHEAAAHGVPLVVSPLIANQLQWMHDGDYFAAEQLGEMGRYCIELFQNRETWERFRTNSLARARMELSATAFESRLRAILNELVSTRSEASTGKSLA